MYLNAAGTHAGLLLEDGTVGVLEKGATSGTFVVDDAAGSWAGESVYVVAPFDADGIDAVSGSFSAVTDGVSSSDFEFSGSGGTCSEINVDLTDFRAANGVYDGGTASGGTGDECPTGGVAADAYMSYDADFMVLYAGCEAATSVGDCSFAILSRTGGGTDGGSEGGTDGGSDGGTDDGTDDGSDGGTDGDTDDGTGGGSDSGSGDDTVDTSLTPSPIDVPVQVNTTTELQQQDPSIAVQEDGRYFIAWEDFLEGTRGRHYGSHGTPITGELEIAAEMSTGNPAVSALSDGSIVAAYGGDDADLRGVLARIYDATLNPTVSEFTLNATTLNDQTHPELAALAGGGFAATWTSDGQDGDGNGVYGAVFTSTGSRVSDEFRVNTETANDQSFPAVAGLSSGGFVITWQSSLQDGESAGIYAQRFDSMGNPVGGEFQVNNEEMFSTPGLDGSAVAALPDGEFIVAWDIGGGDVAARQFDGSGSPLAPQVQVNTTEEFTQHRPAVTALEGGGSVSVWISTKDGSWTVYGQRLDASGSAIGEEFEVPTEVDEFGTTGNTPSVKGLPDGGFVVAWTGNGTSDGGVMMRRYTVAESGAGSDDGSGSTTSGFVGTWSGSSLTSSSTPDCDGERDSGTIMISEVDSSTLSVEGFGTPFTGDLGSDGTTLSANESFSYPEDGGTTTVTDWSATLDAGGDSFSGNSSFEFTDGSFECSGTSTFSGTRS